MSKVKIEFDKNDIIDLVKKAIERSDREVTIYVGQYGTTITIKEVSADAKT